MFVLQPMDQGVIKSLKTQYRKFQILKMIQNVENNNEKKLTVLDAIMMISAAWENVSEKTISNCFRHAGFKESIESHQPTNQAVDYDEATIHCLAKELNPSLSENIIQDFVDIDYDVAICSSLTDQDIIEEIQDEEKNNDDDDEEEELFIPSLNEALTAATTLKQFLSFTHGFSETDVQNLGKIVSIMQNNYIKIISERKQSKITDFVKITDN